MKRYNLYIFLFFLLISLFFIFSLFYQNKIHETFDNNIQHQPLNIILLGDSILKNNSFVNDGYGIDDILRTKTKDNVYNFAIDNSTVVEIYSQIAKIPPELNNPNTFIFLSVGGNDILLQYSNKDNLNDDIEPLHTIFAAYKKLVRTIQSKMGFAKLILLDIYYPTNMKFDQYKSILAEWNFMLKKYVANSNNNIKNILPISGILTKSTDFTLSIEPSSLGGEKIANKIIDMI